MPKPKVLIVDDKPANILVLEALLADYVDEEGQGIEVLPADSGEKGLQILLDTTVDLILLDVQMPGLDGYETARLIGMSKRTSNIPIIFISAVYNDELHMTRGYKGGAIDFISKPINPDFLKAKIGNFLKIQRAIRHAAEIEKEKEALLETTRLKSEFLMNMNHELRTPMNGVLGMVDILLMNKGINTDQKECLETIKSSGKHMLHMVEDILDIASLEANRLVLSKQPFSPRQLLEDLNAMYRAPAEKKQLQFTVDMDPSFNESLMGDAKRLTQAISNLLSNALKFTKQGKISLSFKSKRGFDNHMLTEFEVQDSGVGIAPEDKDSLFHLFSQADGSSTKRYAGTGLGLVITKRLVELMGGSISWTSEVNRGTTFKLSIPFEAVPTVISPATAINVQSPVPTVTVNPMGPTQTEKSSKGSVLLVDDNSVNLKVAERMVKRLGFDCDTADNGRQGVDAFKRKQDYRVILMDCLMPEMDGFEATQYIRKMENGHIPIIAITANNTTIDKEKCLRAGMDSFIAKPLEIEVLEKELNHWTQLPKEIKETL